MKHYIQSKPLKHDLISFLLCFQFFLTVILNKFFAKTSYCSKQSNCLCKHKIRKGCSILLKNQPRVFFQLHMLIKICTCVQNFKSRSKNSFKIIVCHLVGTELQRLIMRFLHRFLHRFSRQNCESMYSLNEFSVQLALLTFRNILLKKQIVGPLNLIMSEAFWNVKRLFQSFFVF